MTSGSMGTAAGRTRTSTASCCSETSSTAVTQPSFDTVTRARPRRCFSVRLSGVVPTMVSSMRTAAPGGVLATCTTTVAVRRRYTSVAATPRMAAATRSAVPTFDRAGACNMGADLTTVAAGASATVRGGSFTSVAATATAGSMSERAGAADISGADSHVAGSLSA